MMLRDLEINHRNALEARENEEIDELESQPSVVPP